MKFVFCLIFAAIIIAACGSEKPLKQLVQLPYVLVLPSEIKHNYTNQNLAIRGLKFDGHYNYDVQVGEEEKIKARAFFQPDKKGEIETGILLCLLPEKPRLKPGIQEITISLNLAPFAKTQIKVLDDPFAPKPNVIRGDKFFALAIFLVVFVVLLALIFAVRAATRKEQGQQGGP